MPIAYTLSRIALRADWAFLARFRVEGLEAVPPKGSLIVVANHMSNLDPPVLVAAIPRKLQFVAKRGIFSIPIAAAFFRAIGAHPTDRSGKDVGALVWLLKMLKEDRVVAIFAEGARSRDGSLKRAQPGVAYLALKSQAPILPVAITGTKGIQSYLRVAYPLRTIRVKIGEPFTLPPIEGTPSREVMQSLADMIMQRVALLLPERYRGYYSTPSPSGTGVARR